MLSPGATMTIELPPDEVVFSLGASDNGIITGEGQAERVAAGAQTTTDPNLLVFGAGDVTNPSGFIMMKALRHLEPQPYHVIGRWTNPVTGKLEYRHHSFELRTIPGGPEQADAFYTVVFSDPVPKGQARCQTSGGPGAASRQGSGRWAGPGPDFHPATEHRL